MSELMLLLAGLGYLLMATDTRSITWTLALGGELAIGLYCFVRIMMLG